MEHTHKHPTDFQTSGSTNAKRPTQAAAKPTTQAGMTGSSADEHERSPAGRPNQSSNPAVQSKDGLGRMAKDGIISRGQLHTPEEEPRQHRTKPVAT